MLLHQILFPLLPTQERRRLDQICHFPRSPRRPGPAVAVWTCPSLPSLPPPPPHPQSPSVPKQLPPLPHRRLKTASPTATLPCLPEIPVLTEGPPPPSPHSSNSSSRFPRNPPGGRCPRRPRLPPGGSVGRTPSWTWSPSATPAVTSSVPSPSPETTSTLPRESSWSSAAASDGCAPVLISSGRSVSTTVHHQFVPVLLFTCPSRIVPVSVTDTLVAHCQPHNLHIITAFVTLRLMFCIVNACNSKDCLI